MNKAKIRLKPSQSALIARIKELASSLNEELGIAAEEDILVSLEAGQIPTGPNQAKAFLNIRFLIYVDDFIVGEEFED